MNVERWLQKSRILEASVRPLTEIQGYMIDSCLNRGDIEGAKRFIQDWNATKVKPKRDVSKWTPGDHYYALDQKFVTLEAAIEHLKAKGYEFGELRERFQYRENGG